MDGISKADTHIDSLIVTDCARSEGDGAASDIGAAALFAQEPDSLVNFSGAMDRATTMFEWHVLT